MLRDAGDRAPFQPGLLQPEQAEGFGLFSSLSVERWREQVFELCWHQHGGSGLAIDWASALELLVEDRDALLTQVTERRAAESKAIKDAGSSKR